jgi:hypothetical protein
MDKAEYKPLQSPSQKPNEVFGKPWDAELCGGGCKLEIEANKVIHGD